MDGYGSKTNISQIWGDTHCHDRQENLWYIVINAYKLLIILNVNVNVCPAPEIVIKWQHVVTRQNIVAHKLCMFT